jgi:hypothetical protein
VTGDAALLFGSGSLVRGDGRTTSSSTENIPDNVDGALLRRGLAGRLADVEVVGGMGFIVHTSNQQK